MGLHEIKQVVKLFVNLPSPKELGWSDDSNALGMRDKWGNSSSRGKTWEDWRELCQSKHPIKYFLRETLPLLFYMNIMRHVEDAIYYVKCHTLRNYRFHLIDLRGVDRTDKYTHGYMDPCESLALASWAILVRFIENEKPFTAYTEEDLQEANCRAWKEATDEMYLLYNWWTKGRVQEKEKANKLLEAVSTATSKKEADHLSATWSLFEDMRKDKEQEMLLRLVKIREFLWT